jgi:hypothetical protein
MPALCLMLALFMPGSGDCGCDGVSTLLQHPCSLQHVARMQSAAINTKLGSQVGLYCKLGRCVLQQGVQCMLNSKQQLHVCRGSTVWRPPNRLQDIFHNTWPKIEGLVPVLWTA